MKGLQLLFIRLRSPSREAHLLMMMFIFSNKPMALSRAAGSVNPKHSYNLEVSTGSYTQDDVFAVL